MKVVMVSKACVVGAYQTKLEAIGRHSDVDLTVIVPPSWQEAGGNLDLEPLHTDHYELLVEPVRFNGQHHLHHYPALKARIQAIQPDIVHMDEEPYSLVTWLGAKYAKAVGAKLLFFSWQNIFRQYPPPFRWIERSVLNSADFGIMGNAAAQMVWQKKGYTGPSIILPQFGFSPDLFYPRSPHANGTFVIGSASRRLNHEKGVDLILQAAAKLPGNWCVRVAGDGGDRANLEQLAQKLGIADRVRFDGKISSEQVAAYLRQLDVLVLPSRTLPTWKEQFGRVLVEAMASQVPVIGSDSGEIPYVIADAGLVFPENNVDALHNHLAMLQESAEKRQTLGEKGHKRALANYTQEQIAAQTVAVYRKLLTV